MNGLADRIAWGRGRLDVLIAGWAILLAVAVGAAAVRWPSPLLLGIPAVLVVGLALARVEFAILLLVASAPLEFAIDYGADSALTFTKLVGALCFVSFVFHAIVTRRRLVADTLHGLVFAILGVALLSTVFARDVPAAIGTTTRYASFVALFFVISQFVGGHRLQTRIAWVLSVASTVTGVIAMRNFLSGETLQARTTQGDPGDIAFVLATTLPLTFWLLREQGVRRLLVLGMIGAISLSIVLTFSRGAFVGLAAAAVWKLLVERRHMGALVAGMLVAGAAVAAVLWLNSGTVESGLRAKEKVAQENVATRLDAWSKAATFAVDHPVVGIGPGNFRTRYAEVADVPPGIPLVGVVHNAYLDVAAELGVIAMVLFLLYLGLTFARLTTVGRDGQGPPGLAGAVRTALIVGVFSALTLSEQYYAPFWLLGGLAAAMWHERPAREPPRV